MTRAALYARLSRDRTGEETATARQLEDCRAFAAARGWEVAAEFTDSDVSAYKRNAKRPGYQSMLAELEAGNIDVIVAWRLDRLLRRFTDLSDLWKRCETSGTNIATVRDGIDTSTPVAGKLVAVIMSAVAEVEAESLSVREQRKHEETAKKGGRAGGGHRPFGLTRDWSALVEPEAALIRDAVARILAGESMYAIAAEWNADGVRTPTGLAWSPQLLASMLRSPRIAGQRAHRGAIVADGMWPAIIDPDTHARLRAVFGAHHKPGSRPRFLLSGMARCATCGHTLVIRRRHKDKRRYYGCEKVTGRSSCGGVHIGADPLEDFVTEAVLYRLEASADALSAVLAQHQRTDTSVADLEAIRADEAALEQLARDHYADRRIGRAEYLAARDAITVRLDETRGRLAQHNGSGPLQDALSDPDGLRERWDREGLEWRRQLIGAMADCVEVRSVGRGGNFWEKDPVELAAKRSEIAWRY